MFRFAILALVLSASSAWSSDLTPAQKDHLTPTSMSVKEIADSGDTAIYSQNLGEEVVSKSAITNGSFDLDKIINIGKEIWKIIEAGQPVVDIKYDTASAVPSGTKSWDQLTEWKSPFSKHYQVAFKNKFGAEVTRFDFRLLYTYGGSVNGVGKYLTAIKVIPANVSVLWGYDLKADTQVPSVVNVGTPTQPLAGAEILVSWRVKTVMKYVQQTMSFFVKGDGTLEDKNVATLKVTSPSL